MGLFNLKYDAIETVAEQIGFSVRDKSTVYNFIQNVRK